MQPKICYVSTIAWPLEVFMAPHILNVSRKSHITLVTSDSSNLNVSKFGEGVRLVNIQILRNISIYFDILALVNLWNFFRTSEFKCVHSITPKGGLISMLAARLSGVPIRLHTFTGQVWLTRKGSIRILLKAMDKLTAKLATHLLVDSPSQRDFLISSGIVASDKIEVLGEGSISGVNIDRFAPNKSARDNLRGSLNISATDIVFVFIGRLCRDKGVDDLIEAFSQISPRAAHFHLLLIGPDEGGYDEFISNMNKDVIKKIFRFDFTATPEIYMAAADIICLPSYREGFGNVLIEASSVGIPAIASRIYGITDAIVDGVTGCLHEAGEISAIVNLMFNLASNNQLRLTMGAAARNRAILLFSQEHVTSKFENFYQRCGVFG